MCSAGFLAAGKLRHNFYVESGFENSLSKLMKELGKKGKDKRKYKTQFDEKLAFIVKISRSKDCFVFSVQTSYHYE